MGYYDFKMSYVSFYLSGLEDVLGFLVNENIFSLDKTAAPLPGT